MTAKSYWFYLESYVYVLIKGNDLLLYNTLTGTFLTYANKPKPVELVLELNQKKNLYAIEVSGKFIRDNGLEGFKDDISGHFMGDFLDVSLTRKKPFFISPHFDISEDAGRSSPLTLMYVGGDSLLALDELTIYVNENCDTNCTVCNNAGTQFRWCSRRKNEQPPELSLEITDIIEILDQTKSSPIKTINIIGGDLTRYPHLNRLVEVLGTGSFTVNYHFHLSHVKNGIPDEIRTGGPASNVILLVDCSTLSLPGDSTYLQQPEVDKLIFLVQREEEIPILEAVIPNLETENISVQPLFNGHNLDFFKENVFTDQESLSENILDIGTINARKSYNPLKYGHMIIRSNKNVYSDLCGKPLGKIGEITMKAAVVSELSEHGNWLKIRRDSDPCKDCLFDSICPPISNFETTTGIYNSCNIWKNNNENHHGALK